MIHSTNPVQKADSAGGRRPVSEGYSSLSVQRERYIRDEIQQFVRANFNLSTAAGSEA